MSKFFLFGFIILICFNLGSGVENTDSATWSEFSFLGTRYFLVDGNKLRDAVRVINVGEVKYPVIEDLWNNMDDDIMDGTTEKVEAPDHQNIPNGIAFQIFTDEIAGDNIIN
jgi:hypothetical protein